jgi:hypothetical protein
MTRAGALGGGSLYRIYTGSSVIQARPASSASGAQFAAVT